MKIAVAVKDDWGKVSGHAGKARDWLVFDCRPGAATPEPRRVVLTEAQLPHNFRGDGPHPLRGVAIVVAASAGDGLLRHMRSWGAQVLLTGERDPRAALENILRGQALPDTRFDVTTVLCKIRDLFSRH